MGVWELLLVGVVILLGLAGVLVPGLPGSWLVWAAVLWWALSYPQPLSWAVLVGATAVLLLAQAIRWMLPPRRLRESGATTRMAVYAGAGATLGFFLVPVVGAIPGFVGGIYLSERLRLGGHGPHEDRGADRDAGRWLERADGTLRLPVDHGCVAGRGDLGLTPPAALDPRPADDPHGAVCRPRPAPSPPSTARLPAARRPMVTAPWSPAAVSPSGGRVSARVPSPGGSEDRSCRPARACRLSLKCRWSPGS